VIVVAEKGRLNEAAVDVSLTDIWCSSWPCTEHISMMTRAWLRAQSPSSADNAASQTCDDGMIELRKLHTVLRYIYKKK